MAESAQDTVREAIAPSGDAPPTGAVQQPQTGSATPAASGFLTIRSVFLGALWMALLAVVIPYNDYRLESTFITGNHFPIGLLFILALLILVVNVLWRLGLFAGESLYLLMAAITCGTYGTVSADRGIYDAVGLISMLLALDIALRAAERFGARGKALWLIACAAVPATGVMAVSYLILGDAKLGWLLAAVTVGAGVVLVGGVQSWGDRMRLRPVFFWLSCLAVCLYVVLGSTGFTRIWHEEKNDVPAEGSLTILQLAADSNGAHAWANRIYRARRRYDLLNPQSGRFHEQMKPLWKHKNKLEKQIRILKSKRDDAGLAEKTAEYQAWLPSFRRDKAPLEEEYAEAVDGGVFEAVDREVFGKERFEGLAAAADVRLPRIDLWRAVCAMRLDEWMVILVLLLLAVATVALRVSARLSRVLANPEAHRDTNDDDAQRAPWWRPRNALLLAILAGGLVVAEIVALKTTDKVGGHVWDAILPIAGYGFLAVVVAAAMLGVLSFLRGGRSPLSMQELVTVWIMMLVGSGIPSSGLMRYMMPYMVHPIYFADDNNEWREKLWPNLPAPLMPSMDQDSVVVKKFYEGFRESELKKMRKTLWQAVPWWSWVGPFAAWLVIIFGIYFLMFCLSVILRRQWEEREKLNFPLVQVPMELVAEPGAGRLLTGILRNPWFWIGVSIPVFIHGLNGLHVFNGNWPQIETSIKTADLFREMPWRSMMVWNIFIFFTVIGFVYLLPVEISFSLWFFFIFSKLEMLFGAVTGMQIGGRSFNWWNEPMRQQQMGAYLAYSTLLIWVARRHLIAVGAKALPFLFTRAGEDEEAASWMRSVIAAFSIALMGAFLWILNSSIGLMFGLQDTAISGLHAGTQVLLAGAVGGGLVLGVRLFLLSRSPPVPGRPRLDPWIQALVVTMVIGTASAATFVFFGALVSWLIPNLMTLSTVWHGLLVLIYVAITLVMATMLVRRLAPRLGEVIADEEMDDSREALSYRTALLGFVGGTVALAVLAWTFLGMNPILVAAMLILLLVISMVLTRIVVQGGMPFILHSFGPHQVVMQFAGPQVFDPQTITASVMVNGVIARDSREILMPYVMNSYKIGGDVGLRRRRLTYIMAGSILIATILAGGSRIYLSYKYGGLNLRRWSMRDQPGYDMQHTQLYQKKPLPASVKQGLTNLDDSYAHLLWVGWGAGLMGFLHFMAGRFYWWPIHPLGLLLVPSYAILMFWWSIFLGWLLKVTILKYGGSGTFRKLRPLFIGLIIGDCLIGGLWIVVGLVRGGRILSIMPG